MASSSTSIPRGQRLALAVLCAATFMSIVDETVVGVALPTIQRELGFAGAELAWVVDAYLIAFGGLLLLAGRIGDLVGRDRVLLAGVALFTAASVLCGAAQSPGWLVAARFVQGAGGALAAAVALGMVVSLFEQDALRSRAIGIYSFVGAAGASSGLLLGGLVTDVLDWRWAFFLNVPVGVATTAAAWRVLPRESGPGWRGGADATGAALVVAGLMLGIWAIVTGRAVLGVAAAALLALFAARQATAAHPLVPPRLLRARVVVTNLAHALLVGAMFGFQFLVTLYFQQVLGYSPAEAGLGILPVALGIGALSLGAFPRLAARFGAAALLPGALLAIAAGMALLARVPVDGSYAAHVLPSVLLFAAGGGLALPSAMTLAMSAATPADAGIASGLINTSQQVGGAVGLAVLATLAASRSEALGGGEAALVEGFRLAWTVGAVLVVAALALAVALLRFEGAEGRADRAARRGGVRRVATCER